MASSTTVDDSAWPVLRLSLAGPPDAAPAEHYLERMASYLEPRDPFAVVIELRDTGPRGLVRAWSQADSLIEHADGLGHRCVGMVAVAEGQLLRVVLRVLARIRPLRAPSCVCADPDHARAWASERLGRG